MKVLVIPDVHLKPWMFERASKILKEKEAEKAVCLMDLSDDWKQQYNLSLYEKTYDAAIRFAIDFPQTLWCWGNHDLCYLWNQRETGYSKMAPRLVCEKLRALIKALPDPENIAYVHRIGKVLFSHGGLSERFALQHCGYISAGDTDAVLKKINSLGPGEMWQDLSPIWFRPRYEEGRLLWQEDYLQVTGHTPVERIEREGNLISCDVFSTYPDRKPIGTEEFLLLDTLTWEYRGIR